MAILQNLKLLVGEYPLHAEFRSNNVTFTNETQDDTRWDDDTRIMVAGLEAVSMDGEGFWSAGGSGPDDIFSANLSVAAKPVTFALPTGAEGDRAYFWESLQTEYTALQGAVGDAHVFSIASVGSGHIVPNGRVEHALGAETSSGSSTGSQLGAATASQAIFGVLHVTAFNGTSLDINIESDDNSGFTSATTQASFTQATNVTSEFITPVQGAVADDYWRIDWTFVGTSVTFLCAIGIRSKTA